MAKDSRKMQSWQVFHYARKHLGRSALYAIFGNKNARSVDYWCEDPRFTTKGEAAHDPIRGVKLLLEQLDDEGHCAVVRACIDFLRKGTSAGCGFDPEVVDILPTITEEVLADYRAVAALQSAIESGASFDVVGDLKYQAIEEIERTVARYIKDTLGAE